MIHFVQSVDLSFLGKMDTLRMRFNGDKEVSYLDWNLTRQKYEYHYKRDWLVTCSNGIVSKRHEWIEVREPIEGAFVNGKFAPKEIASIMAFAAKEGYGMIAVRKLRNALENFGK